MRLEEMPMSAPGPGQVLVEVKAAGVNLFDTQLRSGLYRRELPLTLGLEGAGIVQAVGAEVTDISVNDRIAWVFAPSYATHALVPSSASCRSTRISPLRTRPPCCSRD